MKSFGKLTLSILAALILLFPLTLLPPVQSAIQQMVVLAVAQSGTRFVNVRDFGIIPDNVTGGMFSTGLMGWDGASADKIPGNATDGLFVSTRGGPTSLSADGVSSPTSSAPNASFNLCFDPVAGDWNRQRDANVADLSGLDGVCVVVNGIVNPNNSTITRWRGFNGTGGVASHGNIQFDLGKVTSQTTGAVNTAVVVNITATTTTRPHLNGFDARCSAGTATITVADGGTPVWSTSTGAIGTTNFSKEFPTALTGTLNQTLSVTLSACGAGNTGTLMVRGARWL